MLKNDLAGGVAVTLTFPAALSGDLAVGAAPLVGDAGSVLPDGVSPTVSARAPLANCVEVQESTDCAAVSPLAVAGGGGLLV